ncbi:hypothetical protein Hanom_Chr01g00049951 [Helianthus anomalus]
MQGHSKSTITTLVGYSGDLPFKLETKPVMSALDFIKSDDTSDVVFEDAPSVPGENVVVLMLE